MRAEILTCIRLLVESDASVTPEHRGEILRVCKRDPSRRRRRLGTVRQAAEILGCHTRTIERYAKRGLVTPVQYSTRKIRYDLDEIEALADRGVAALEAGNDDDSIYVPVQ